MINIHSDENEIKREKHFVKCFVLKGTFNQPIFEKVDAKRRTTNNWLLNNQSRKGKHQLVNVSGSSEIGLEDVQSLEGMMS
jgi:hypothetical protein